MRIVVVGAGSAGKRHLANLRALGHEAAVCDTDPDVHRWARDAGYEIFGLHLSVDAAIIATPVASHLKWITRCLDWRVPVLVEKPLGTVEDLPALVALGTPDVTVMIGYQLRFHESAPLSLRPITDGTFTCRCDASQWPGSAGKGDLLLEYSHEIDLALACGAIPRVSSAVITDTQATIRLAGTVQIVLANRPGPYYRRWLAFDGKGGTDITFNSAEQLGQSMYVRELQHFLRAVEGGPVAPGCTLEEGIRVLDVIAQARRMANGSGPRRPVFPLNRVIKEGHEIGPTKE